MMYFVAKIESNATIRNIAFLLIYEKITRRNV